jgi:sigma-B regulation protein RsbU (phosphoserine phosphatase)
VAAVTDYLAQESLQRIQDEFVSVLRIPLRICLPDGRPVTKASAVWREPPSPTRAGAGEREPDFADACGPVTHADVPIRLEGRLLGRIVVRPPGSDWAAPLPAEPGAPEAPPRALRLLQLMANVIARRWNRQKLLRSRIAELAAMYRLTAEFTGRRDLQSVLELVTRTVVELFGAKACAIRLLNESQSELVVKAAAGLSPRYLTKGPILLSKSRIDREVVAHGRTVYIPDLRSDPRVLYPEEADEEGIVSGLCAPLSYKGRCEGVIRIYTGEPHDFDWYERSLLRALAAQAAAAIVNTRLYEQAVRGANLRRHVSMAAEVQRRMFPAGVPELPGFEIHAVYEPTFELSGDFYDFHQFEQDNLGVGVCDVVGKGIRASLLMASIRASLRAHASNIYDMSEVLARVNRDLCADTAIRDFATLFYGVIDARGRRFTYANAGHTPPLLIRGGQCCHLTTGGGVVGIDPGFSWRHDTMAFAPGDVVAIFTDGLTEALNFQDEGFGMARVERAAVAAVADRCSAAGIARRVLWELRRFTGLRTRLDDLTLVVIKVL